MGRAERMRIIVLIENMADLVDMFGNCLECKP